MRLIVDLDGVLADIASGMITRLGYPIHPAEYNLLKAYPQFSKDIIDDIVADPGFYWDLYPIPGSREHLAALSEKWEICYVTGRPEERAMGDVTAMWLIRHGYPLGGLWVIGDRSKAIFILEKFGRDIVAIEDCAEIASGLAWSSFTLLLKAHYWPYNTTGYGLALPVDSWKEIAQVLKEKYGSTE